jgi:membrane-associated phospholipid phosphatase
VNKSIALLLSMVLQPLAMPTLICAVILFVVPEATSIPAAAKWSLLLLISLTTLVIPLLSLLGMKMTASINSFQMPEKKERILPFSLISVFYVMTAAFFHYRIRVDQLILTTLIMITVCLILLTCITYFWKISSHLTGIAGLLAAIVVLSMKYGVQDLFYPFIVAVLACGAVGTARLALNAHKPLEVYGGFMLGFGWSFGVYYYVLMGS